MTRRALRAFLAVFLAVPAPAAVLGRVVPGRGSYGTPLLLPKLPYAPGMTGLGSMPLLAANALTPTLALAPAPALAPTPTLLAAPAAPAEAPKPVLDSVRAVGETVARDAAKGSDARPSLDKSFDGLAVPADAPSVAAAPSADPAGAFASRAAELFAGRALQPGQSLGVAWSKPQARPDGSIPGDGELNDRVARSPLTNAERMKTMVELFKLGGATDADITLQDAGRGQSNVIVTKKGRSDRVIVVGGHYDKVSEGHGTIDNWTGATLVANLHQALHGVDTEATVVFIAFAREEEGLIGSSKYVRSLNKAQRDKIDAMVNLDTLAVDGTYAWKGHSTQALVDRFVRVSAESGHPGQAAPLSGGDADSSSFRDAGIPAVTIFGASQDVIFDIIHSERDNMAAFNLAHYKNAYLLTLELLKSLDRSPLGPDGRRRA